MIVPLTELIICGLLRLTVLPTLVRIEKVWHEKLVKFEAKEVEFVRNWKWYLRTLDIEKLAIFTQFGITIRISEISSTKNRLATLQNSRTKISRVGNTSRFKSTPTGTFEYTDHISQEQFHTLKSLFLLFVNYKYRLAKRIWHFNESGQLHFLLNVFSFF